LRDISRSQSVENRPLFQQTIIRLSASRFTLTAHVRMTVVNYHVDQKPSLIPPKEARMSAMPTGHTAGRPALTLATITRSQDPCLDIFSAAILGSDRRVAELLQEAPSLARAMRVDGKTPLHLAARAGYLATMQQLLSHGADPNAGDESGQTPL